MANTLKEKAEETFRKKFGSEPRYTIQAPGRINLIGEHTDYSGGFVLPVAIDLGIAIAISPRDDTSLNIYSADFDQSLNLDLYDFSKGNIDWQEYIKGVAWVLKDKGEPLVGWDGVIVGNVPIGAGLSSSAALEVGTAKVFSKLSNLGLNSTEIALISQQAENEWVGVKVGIMDQLASALGKEGYAIQIDCRSLNYEYVPIPPEISFVVLDTGTRRELTNSAYNTRRDECENASQILGISALRDADLEMLEEKKDQMSDLVYRRARHVITENIRVHQFNNAMREGNLSDMGKLIYQSHLSLKNDFEVSNNELDSIVEIAKRHASCIGARMIGAGFGGCALAIVETSKSDGFSEVVNDAYYSETGIQPKIFIVHSSNGVQVS